MISNSRGVSNSTHSIASTWNLGYVLSYVHTQFCQKTTCKIYFLPFTYLFNNINIDFIVTALSFIAIEQS